MKAINIERRTISIGPAADADVPWLLAQFDQEDVWSQFRLGGPARERANLMYFAHPLIMGIVRRAGTHERIGFTLLFPPDDRPGVWQFGGALPDRRHRDAFSAIYALDSTLHYVFDWLPEMRAVEFTTRVDNRAAFAVLERSGYTDYEQVDTEDGPIALRTITREGWAERKAHISPPGTNPFRISAYAGQRRFTTVAAETPEPVL